eukprot:680184_1
MHFYYICNMTELSIQNMDSVYVPLIENETNRHVVEWADTDYEPEGEAKKEINALEYESCCECNNCIIGFAKIWLGCGCTQFGYSVIFWYIINLGTDIYYFIATSESRLLLVLYSFNILFVDLPVLVFTIRDQQFKLLFPFAANTAMALITVVYSIDKIYMDEVHDVEIIHTGIWTIAFDGLLFFMSALSLIPLFTYRLKLWDKTDINHSILYPHSSAVL